MHGKFYVLLLPEYVISLLYVLWFETEYPSNVCLGEQANNQSSVITVTENRRAQLLPALKR